MHDDAMASTPDEYWARRRALTPSTKRPATADGGSRLALQVDLSDGALSAAYDRLRSRLEPFTCLETVPPDQLHLTVKLLDRALTEPLASGDDPAPADRVDESIASIAAECGPFDIDFPRLNLFPDAVYAEVDADDALSWLNRALCACPWAATTDRDVEQFIPHLTLGYLTGEEQYDDLVTFLERHRDPDLPTVTVEELTVALYDDAPDAGAAPRTVRTYTL
jgi:2'-5' RNA ligase